MISPYDERVCLCKTVEGIHEIWVYVANENTGLTFTKISELSWGDIIDRWNTDGVTSSTVFDPTDTSLYSWYEYPTILS